VPVNTRGFDIKASTSQELANGVPVIAIKGEITNITDRELPVPKLNLRVLDQNAIQKVLREVDMRDLAISLKTSSDELKAALLGAISKRAAETVNEEMSYLGAVKLKDIEGAQLRIIEVVRRLEGEGEIELGEGRELNETAMV